MLKTQQTFFDYLNDVQAELRTLTELQDNVQAIEPLKQELANAELIVPVVGAFSAGKTTLINSFLGDERLLVGITPETSLATELRYSETESIEAIGTNGEGSPVANLEVLKEQAKQYKYAKVFLNSEPLRSIQPLVLVDMPGFDSPLDLHNRAILTYLNRGSHYAVLVSVEEGTVTHSVQRRIAEIHEAGKRFSVFLSKANLRSPTEVKDLVEAIEERITDDFGLGGSVVPVGSDGGESLAKMLHAIDPEALFDRLWRPDLETHYFDLHGSLNTRISSLQKDERENQEIIEGLANGLQDLQRKKDEMIADIRARYSTSSVNSIVEGVGQDLGSAVDELTQLAMSDKKDELDREISEIVRASLMARTKDEMGRVQEQIVDDLKDNLKGISDRLHSYDNTTIEQSSIEQYLRKTPWLAGVGSQILGALAKVTGSKALYRIAAAVFGITTSIVAPLVEVAILFLPDIFGLIFGGRGGQREEEFRNQFIGTVIPSVKNKIRSELPKLFEEQVNTLITEQVKAIDEHINTRQKEIAAAEQTRQDKIQDIEQTITQLTSIRDNIRTLANQAVFTRGETNNG